MTSNTNSIQSPRNILSIVLDFTALAFIYFVPTLSHLVSMPLYFMEPMRLMLILALVHTNKTNAFILALSLPLFSYLVSAHPVFPKMILITFELSLNVLLFYLLNRKIKKIFLAILLSIILSKTAYYIIKFGLLKMLILKGGLVSTPLFIQLVTTLIFSGYVYLMLREAKAK